MTPEGILRTRKRREGHAPDPDPVLDAAVTVENPISARPVVRRPFLFAAS